MLCSYYYDTETGFYYLQSRYYDPVTHRFINADSYASTDATDAIACNMFAYCYNNPVICTDTEGNRPFTNTMMTDGGHNMHCEETASPVYCAKNCDSFSNQYFSSYYKMDIEDYGSSVSGGSSYTHVKIETVGRYMPPSKAEYIVNAVCDYLKSEYIVFLSTKLFSGAIGKVVSCAIGIAGAISAGMDVVESHPVHCCTVYRVTISNTFYDFGSTYNRHTTVSTQEFVLYYGIEDGTSNIYLLHGYTEG